VRVEESESWKFKGNSDDINAEWYFKREWNANSGMSAILLAQESNPTTGAP
jgi:hypothetical protein